MSPIAFFGSLEYGSGKDQRYSNNPCPAKDAEDATGYGLQPGHDNSVEYPQDKEDGLQARAIGKAWIKAAWRMRRTPRQQLHASPEFIW